MSNFGGLNMEPGQSYRFIDRFTCAKCGNTPELVKAEGTDPVIATIRCCGHEVTKAYQKSELVFQQRVFDEEESE
jgi:predicted nucleic acid-binding Zn ribbon protein